MDFSKAVARSGEWFFFVEAKNVSFCKAIFGRCGWDEFEEAQEIALLIAEDAGGNC